MSKVGSRPSDPDRRSSSTEAVEEWVGCGQVVVQEGLASEWTADRLAVLERQYRSGFCRCPVTTSRPASELHLHFACVDDVLHHPSSSTLLSLDHSDVGG